MTQTQLFIERLGKELASIQYYFTEEKTRNMQMSLYTYMNAKIIVRPVHAFNNAFKEFNSDWMRLDDIEKTTVSSYILEVMTKLSTAIDFRELAKELLKCHDNLLPNDDNLKSVYATAKPDLSSNFAVFCFAYRIYNMEITGESLRYKDANPENGYPQPIPPELLAMMTKGGK